MTPKEKAKELYWKYYQEVSDTSYPEEKAKQCALIAVDEIINYLKLNNIYGTLMSYWQEVKKELNKL